MKHSKHSQAIPASVLEQAKVKLNEVNELLSPYIVPLTAAERQEILKMGPKTLSFVEKAHEYAIDNPSLRPPYLDMEAFGIDFADAHGLWAIQTLARQVYENLSDTSMSAGSEAYQEALVFYKSVKVAAQQDVPGAKAIYEELRTRFAGNRRKSSSNDDGADL